MMLGYLVGEIGPTLGPEFGTAAKSGFERVVHYFAVTFVWLLWRLTTTVTNPAADADSPIDPVASWRRDRRRGLMAGLGAGLTVGITNTVAIWLMHWPTPLLAAGLTSGLGIGLLVGITYSRTYATSLAFAQIRWAGHGPLRLLAFLEDARQRDVLRTAGPLYEFRHTRLQDRLALRFREGSSASDARRSRRPPGFRDPISPAHAKSNHQDRLQPSTSTATRA